MDIWYFIGSESFNQCRATRHWSLWCRTRRYIWLQNLPLWFLSIMRSQSGIVHIDFKIIEMHQTRDEHSHNGQTIANRQHIKRNMYSQLYVAVYLIYPENRSTTPNRCDIPWLFHKIRVYRLSRPVDRGGQPVYEVHQAVFYKQGLAKSALSLEHTLIDTSTKNMGYNYQSLPKLQRRLNALTTASLLRLCIRKKDSTPQAMDQRMNSP